MAFGIFCGMGLSFALWIDFGMSYAPGSVSWRFPLGFATILPLVVMALIFTMPESARWLCTVDRAAEARDILFTLHGDDLDAGRIEKSIRDIQISLQMSEGASLMSIFTMGRQRTFHRCLLAITGQILLQISGVNAITYYASSIYDSDLHFPATKAKIVAAASQGVIVLGSVVCSFTVDRFGRRRLMLSSAAGMSICMACLTGLVSNADNKAALKCAVFFLYAYYFVYVLGFWGSPSSTPARSLPSTFVLPSAVYLLPFLGSSISSSRRSPPSRSRISRIAILLSTAPSTPPSCRASTSFFPETVGRSLEEMEEIFTASRSIWDPVRVAQWLPRKNLADYLKEEGEVEPKVGSEHMERRGEA